MPSVLIVDDDAKHRDVVRHLLERLYPGVKIDEYDAEVSGTPNHIADIQVYDLVIMDTTVAGQDSLVWMTAVIKHYADAPAFIILSSITDATTVVMQQLVIAIKHGAVNFHFKKKLDMKHLIQDICGVLEKLERDESAAAQATAPATSPDVIEGAVTDVGLAINMVQGHKNWPFTMETILAGKASIGKYKITAFLGEDNAASTFKATMQAINTPVVIKLINRLRLAGKTIPTIFTKHFDAIVHRRHPNIIHLFNYEVIGSRMVVAMEYLHDGTLEERLIRSRLDEAEAIHFFRQLLAGIMMLHEMGIELHQITPRQLMLRDEHTLVITHLGLINELHALSDINGEWSLPYATPVYTTPESVQKQPTDLRSDIYLAGLIGYEMLVGKPPFATGSDQDILYAHAAEPMPSLPDRRDPMNNLLAGMLSKMPEKRPKNAKEILAELDKIYPP